MSLHYLIGDATKPIEVTKTKIIAHICNDMGGWGRGFVLALSNKWKEPEEQYRSWKLRNWKGKPFKLGQIQTVWVEGNTFVCNMIAQRDFTALEENGIILGLPNVNYTSLHECLKRLTISLTTPFDVSIHMPRIGAGLGGGDWNKIETIIKSSLASVYEVYVYDLTPVPGTTYENLDKSN